MQFNRREFIKAGHDMWVMKEITGVENAGPMVLTPPAAVVGADIGTRSYQWLG